MPSRLAVAFGLVTDFQSALGPGDGRGKPPGLGLV